MKKIIVTSPILFLFLAISGGALLPVTAQINESGPMCNCRTEKPGTGRSARRVPLALSDKDETGSIVYTINANESLRRTGIEVPCGQRIEVSAGGIVRWAPDGIEKIDVTPDGTRPPYRGGWNYLHFPFPEAGIGSLVMRIGEGVYPVGSTAVIQVEDAGFVEFMVNDDVLHDNSGLFHVKVKVDPQVFEARPDTCAKN